MFELSLNFITGMMFGLEFVNPNEISEDLDFLMVVDLGILRIMIMKWNKED
jgi:hypothetical protein